MAISKCKELVISRKRFSDFKLFDPTSKEETENVFLAGYIEDENGDRENVKMKAKTFLDKSVTSTAIGTLDENASYDDIAVITEKKDDKNIKVINIDSDAANFIQINAFKNNLFSDYDGKSYVSFRLSENIPFGTVIRFYLPNFASNKGVMIWPTPNLSIKEDTPVEVFFNEIEPQIASDFYFTVIQLADPQNVGNSKIVTKTKVIEVNNITQEL